ncbi:hypothetical protein P9302_09470 [Brevibacillus agri]|nr:hypothetical protein [Brevibacillus agri]
MQLKSPERKALLADITSADGPTRTKAEKTIQERLEEIKAKEVSA